jgi:hypothetical protein
MGLPPVTSPVLLILVKRGRLGGISEMPPLPPRGQSSKVFIYLLLGTHTGYNIIDNILLFVIL